MPNKNKTQTKRSQAPKQAPRSQQRNRQKRQQPRVPLGPPTAVGFATRVAESGNMSTMRVSGRLGAIQIAADTPTGEVLYELLLNPLMWTNTRVQQEARLWQQFRFRRLVISVKPGVPTICSGAYVHGHDTEAENMLLRGDGLLQYLSYLPGASFSNIWNPSAAICNVQASMRSQNWYKVEYGGTDRPAYCQGVYMFALAEPFTGVSPGQVGISFWADGEIEFCGRRIPQEAEPAFGVKIPSDTVYDYKPAQALLTTGNFPTRELVDNVIYLVQPLEVFSYRNPAFELRFLEAIVNIPGSGLHAYETFNDAINGVTYTGDPTDPRTVEVGGLAYSTGVKPEAALTFRSQLATGQSRAKASIRPDLGTAMGLLSLQSTTGSSASKLVPRPETLDRSTDNGNSDSNRGSSARAVGDVVKTVADAATVIASVVAPELAPVAVALDKAVDTVVDKVVPAAPAA